MSKGRNFSGKDPMRIFDFLTRLSEEAETLDISEGHLMVLLTHLLTGNAGEQYRAASNGSRSGNFGG